VVADALGLSRADAQRAIDAGRVTVDRRIRPKSFHLGGGEIVRVTPRGASVVPAEGPPVEIRHEDPYLLVVAKPPGLVTHPTASRRSGTLVNRLLAMELPLSSVGGELRPGIVHRLDAGTSGLLIIAKDDETHLGRSSLLRKHEIERRYLALARGGVEHERFSVDAPLGRRGARVQVHTGAGKPAETAFEVRRRFERATLLEAVPRTGRTHQIRVHLRAIHHPILGDRRYGGGGDDATHLGLGRPFLHAWHLSFEHPRTGARIEVEDPLPDDLGRVLAALAT